MERIHGYPRISYNSEKGRRGGKRAAVFVYIRIKVLWKQKTNFEWETLSMPDLRPPHILFILYFCGVSVSPETLDRINLQHPKHSYPT